MRKKYNFALLPIKKINSFVQCAQHFNDIADKYILGKNSLPHITLYQFEIEEMEINNILMSVRKGWDKEPVDLVLDKFSYLTFDNDIYWVSLLPNRSDVLYKMHKSIAGLINRPVKETFDPHLTLINTKNRNYEIEVEKYAVSYRPIQDLFVLSFGSCDDAGQFTEVIFNFDGIGSDVLLHAYEELQEHRAEQLNREIDVGMQQLRSGKRISAKDSYNRLKSKINKVAKERA